MTNNEEVKQTAWGAYALLQGELDNPAFDKQVKVPGKYEFRYASLAAILKMVRPILARNGFSLTQSPDTVDGRIEVTTRLTWLDGTVVAQSKLTQRANENVQQLGSQITYLRRYSVGALLGIAADEDDDGGAATGNGSEVYSKVPNTLVRADQIDEINLLIVETRMDADCIINDLVALKSKPLYDFEPDALAKALAAIRAGGLVVKDGHIVKPPQPKGK